MRRSSTGRARRSRKLKAFSRTSSSNLLWSSYHSSCGRRRARRPSYHNIRPCGGRGFNTWQCPPFPPMVCVARSVTTVGACDMWAKNTHASCNLRPSCARLPPATFPAPVRFVVQNMQELLSRFWSEQMQEVRAPYVQYMYSAVCVFVGTVLVRVVQGYRSLFCLASTINTT